MRTNYYGAPGALRTLSEAEAEALRADARREALAPGAVSTLDAAALAEALAARALAAALRRGSRRAQREALALYREALRSTDGASK